MITEQEIELYIKYKPTIYYATSNNHENLNAKEIWDEREQLFIRYVNELKINTLTLDDNIRYFKKSCGSMHVRQQFKIAIMNIWNDQLKQLLEETSIE